MLMTEHAVDPSHSGLEPATVRLLKSLIVRYCDSDDLRTYDPYDIWQTRVGLAIKDTFNRNRHLGLIPAAAGALLDNFCNKPLRKLYCMKEYAIVRAFAALSLHNLSAATGEQRWTESARRHLRWLASHSCNGFSGPCWGLGFPHAATPEVVYDANTPFSVITPYALEAFDAFAGEPDGEEWRSLCGRVFNFFDRDIQVMEEDGQTLATSYGPFRDRTVVNATSYNMYAHSICLRYVPQERLAELLRKIRKMYAFVKRQQRADGSWFYSPHGRPFIDCFHSCIVLKNIVKTSRLIDLPDAEAVVAAGYEFVTKAFFDRPSGLFKRFALKNKPGLVRFDLYDNAEVLQLAALLEDHALARSLIKSILASFYDGHSIYSEIDLLGVRRRKDTLRWAVMPFLHAASLMV